MSLSTAATRSATASQGGSSLLAERVEQKFFIPPAMGNWVLGLLRRVCRADPVYPADQVNSLYFDTPGLDQYERSDSGDFAKDKVRIRWYGERHDPHRGSGQSHQVSGETVQVWLELKSRRGFASFKQRRMLEVPATALDSRALVRGVLPRIMLAQMLAEFGFFPHEPLVPVVAISYQRRRFVEPATGFRVSLDSRVRSTVVRPGLGNGERGLELAGMVVEIKGPRLEVPASLGVLTTVGSSWTRYSKYSSSLDAHGASPSTASRLWPSGLMPPQVVR